MPYIETRYRFRDSIEIERRHSGRYGAPGQRRLKRKKPTPEEIKKQNQRHREKNMRRIIKANFVENDYWTTLTYRNGQRPDQTEAKKHTAKFLRKLRAAYRARGIELKYIIKTEVSSRGFVHHHILCNRGPDADLIIRKLWKYGTVDIKLTYADGDYRALAEYIVKQDEEKTKGSSRYSRSRNLTVPQPEKRIMKRKDWDKDPRPHKGYYIDKDSIVEGINPITGYRYQYFTMIRIKRRE